MDSELQQELKTIYASIFNQFIDTSKVPVFRGQAKSSQVWKPYPTLYRRLLNHHFSEDEITEHVIRRYESDILCESNGLGHYQSNRIATMVALQHHGGSTRLLDVTRDPFVALWFAVDYGFDGDDGELICYHFRQEYVIEHGIDHSWDTLTEDLPAGGSVLYFPSPGTDDRRISAQSSGFISTHIEGCLADGCVFTKGSESVDIRHIIIPAETKKELRSYLAKCRGLNCYDIFPDFDGYAHSHSSNRPFEREYSTLYDESNGIFPDKFRYPN